MVSNMRSFIGAAAIAFGVMSAPQAGLADTAKERFEWFCVQCHGQTGKGDGINSVDEMPVGPIDLTSSKEMAKFTNEMIIGTLTHGGPANTLDALMPPWGDTFSAEEIDELMHYVRSLCQDAACPPK
ncbi:MAG: c-type cytochrome [Sphingomonadales bacterium]